MRRLVTTVALVAVVCGSVAGQPKPVKHKVSLDAKLSQDKVHAGSVVSAALIANIEQGWHINSPAPADENMIATTLAVQRGETLDSVEVSFPHGQEMQFGFTDVPLEVFDGTLLISLKLHVATKVKPGVYTVPVTLRYQACSDNVCLPPTGVSTELVLIVAPSSESVNRINTALFGEGK